jgi:hypothetical protein
VEVGAIESASGAIHSNTTALAKVGHRPASDTENMITGRKRLRVVLSSAVLLVALGGGTFGIEALASHLSSVVAHSEPSLSEPAHTS